MAARFNKLLMILSNSPAMITPMRDRSNLVQPSQNCFSFGRLVSLGIALSVALPLPAHAADRWEEAGGGAVAILPVPAKANGVTGGSLACAEQRWTFRLRVDPSSAHPFGTEGVITVDNEKIPAAVEQAGSIITLPIPFESLQALKAGTRLSIAFGEGKDAPGATFSLRGSKLVIEAIVPRCSPIDMTGYDRIALLEAGPAVDLVRPLLAEEVALFREATNKEPTLAAAAIDLPEQRGLIFGTVCGSTWYYGESGCTLAAFARQSATGEWLPAYSSEGVAIYTDPKAGTGGWPNLVTLPLVNGTEATHWVWTGHVYQLRDHVVAEEDVLADGELAGEGDAQ
jgi:hypothetical protein